MDEMVKKLKDKDHEEDIDTIKEILDLVKDASMYITGAVKSGFKVSDLFQLFNMLADVSVLAGKMHEVMPELKDVDKEEAEELGGILYEIVREIVIASTKEEDK